MAAGRKWQKRLRGKGCRICCRKTGATAAEHFEKQNPCPVSPSSNHPSSPHRPIANLGPQDLEEGCPCWKSPWPPRACSANSQASSPHCLCVGIVAMCFIQSSELGWQRLNAGHHATGAAHQSQKWAHSDPPLNLRLSTVFAIGHSGAASWWPAGGFSATSQATWHVPAAWDQHPKHQPNQPGPWKWLHPSFQSVAKLEPKPYRNRFLSLLQTSNLPKQQHSSLHSLHKNMPADPKAAF